MHAMGQVGVPAITPGHLKVLQAAERTTQRMISATGGNRRRITAELRREDPRLPAKWRKIEGVLRRRGVQKASERALLLTIADAAIDRTIQMGTAIQAPEAPSLSGFKSFMKSVGGWIGDTVNEFACDSTAQGAVADLSFEAKADEGGFSAGSDAATKSQIGMSSACAATGGQETTTGGGGWFAPQQPQQPPTVVVQGGGEKGGGEKDGMPDWLPLAMLGMGGFMLITLLIVAVKD